MAGAGFVASRVNAGAAGVVADAVKLGGFVKDVSLGDAIGGGDTVNGGGEGATWVKPLEWGEGERGVAVEETAAIASVAHDAVAGVNCGVGDRSGFGDMEATSEGGGEAGVASWSVIAGGRDGRSVRGGEVFSSGAKVDFFYFGERFSEAGGITYLAGGGDVKIKLVV